MWDTLTYIDTFEDKHNLNVMIGSSAQNNVFNWMSASVQEFLSDANNQLNNGLTDPTVGGSKNDWAVLSFMARANYNYNNKYLFTATIRRDGSSRFSKENRWGTFPSFSMAVVRRGIFNTNEWVNDRKVRVVTVKRGRRHHKPCLLHRLRTGQYCSGATGLHTVSAYAQSGCEMGECEAIQRW